MRLSGHCARHPEEVASKLILWQPTDGKPKRGRRAMTYIDNLMNDTGTESVTEIRGLMEDRTAWKKRVNDVVRPGGRQK